MDLNFGICSQITDVEVTALVTGLSPAVETLKLDFGHCKAITGEPSWVFPSSLKNMDL